MRRLTVIATVVVAWAVVGAQAASASGLDGFVLSSDPLAIELAANPLAVGADIYAVGGGKADGGFQSFDLSAHTGPQGDFGHYGVKVTSMITGELIVRYKVDVDCVNVHGPGERAVIKGEVKTVSPVPNTFGITPGHRVILGVDDEGNPGDPVQGDDWFAPHADTFLGNCKNIVYIANVNNVSQGNININTG